MITDNTTIKIDNVDVKGLVFPGSVLISDTLNSRNTCSMRLTGDASGYSILEGDEVEIVETRDAVEHTLFTGSVYSSTEGIAKGTTEKVTNVQCVDLNELTDRFLVAQIFEDELAGDIVRDLVSVYLADDNITTNNVQDGITVEKAVWSYIKLSTVLDELSALAGYSWYIDADRDLHFFARETNEAPVVFDDANRDYFAFSKKESRQGYRNRQFIRAGFDQTDPRAESFVGDGETRTFTMGYPLAQVPSIVLSGTGRGHASAVTITTGTYVSGTVADTFDKNGIYYIVQEVTGAPGFLFTFDFNSIKGIPSAVNIFGRYQGSVGHNVNIEAWNYTTVGWDVLGTWSNSAADTDVLLSGMDANHVSGEMSRIRFSHTSPGTASHHGNIDEIHIIFAAGGAQTVGIKGVETGKDWYWNKEDPVITQELTDPPLSEAVILTSTYVGLFPLLLSAEDPGQIAERQSIEGGSGVHEDIIDDRSIDDLDLAIQKAEAILRKEGRINQTLTINTGVRGFVAGQLLTVDLTDEDVTGTYLVTQVNTGDVQGVQFRSTITAVDGESLGTWVDFFKLLKAAGRDYVIRENEVLSLLKRFSDTVTLSDTIDASGAAPENRIGFGTIGFSEIA